MRSRPPRVLVVDDDQDFRLMCRTALEAEGLAVSEAGDAAGLFYASRSDRPDLVMLDLVLPDRGGWECLDDMQQDAELKAVPVLLVTGHAEREAQIRSLTHAAGYLLKPFNRTYLIAAVREVLRREGWDAWPGSDEA